MALKFAGSRSSFRSKSVISQARKSDGWRSYRSRKREKLCDKFKYSLVFEIYAEKLHKHTDDESILLRIRLLRREGQIRMKANCANCRALRDIDYPISSLEEGAFIISGTCAACGGHLEQKRRVVLA